MRPFLLFLLLVVAMNSYTANQYIDDVLAGRQVVCKWVRLAVERHVRDLARAERKDPDFPYYFDEAQAKRIIDFTQQLQHTKGEWANPCKHDPRIRLEPWQQFIDWVLFGWRREGGYRRFTRAYIEVARKNGKTTDAAAKANYCFLADRPQEIGAEVYCVATKRDQAKIAWDEAQRQIDRNSRLKELTQLYRQSSTIVIPGTAAKMKPLGQDSDTEDGLNPHFVLVDEYHAHPDSSMLNVMESGTGSREQPLIYIITTAGFNKECPCYREEHQLAERVLERSLSPVPENYFCIIYTLDEGDDWADPKVWIKANPNLGVSLRWKFLEDRVREAQQSATKQNDVKTKNLNIWTQAVTRWLSEQAWAACRAKVFPEQLLRRDVFIGLDLSSTIDITAVVLCFPPKKKSEPYQFLFRFFMPKDTLQIREKQDRIPYSTWATQGLITVTEGNAIDYDAVEHQILQDASAFQVQEIAFDPYKAQEIVNHLASVGLKTVAIPQGYSSMSGPSDTFEKKVLAREIVHGDNPVMNWMVSCTEVKSDSRGYFMPVKPQREKTGKRIDGVVAAILSLARAVLNAESAPAKYENETGAVARRGGIRRMEF